MSTLEGTRDDYQRGREDAVLEVWKVAGMFTRNDDDLARDLGVPPRLASLSTFLRLVAQGDLP